MRRLYATRSTPRSAPSVAQRRRRLDPARRGDEEVALRQWRAARRCASRARSAAVLRREWASPCHAPTRDRRSPTSPPPRWSSTRPRSTRNLDTMTAALPGARLRPHVKAHKCTALAREQARRGHTHFTARDSARDRRPGARRPRRRSAPRERVRRSRPAARARRLRGRVTVAVDSDATVDAAAAQRHPRGAHRRERRSCRAAAARPRTRPGSPIGRARPGSRCAASWATRVTPC